MRNTLIFNTIVSIKAKSLMPKRAINLRHILDCHLKFLIPNNYIMFRRIKQDIWTAFSFKNFAELRNRFPQSP